jgi:hypothetical protein
VRLCSSLIDSGAGSNPGPRAVESILHFPLGLFKVMFLRDQDWAGVVKDYSFFTVTILI